MIHAMTVDLEDYRSIVARDYFDREVAPDPIVIDNTHRLLALFAERDVRATFFTLGDVAEAHPRLIREIADAGHELAVHGHHHRQVFKLSPETFRREVEVPKKLIEDLTGKEVRGHRAPAFSIMPATEWAFDVLIDVGFHYDSSVAPIAGKRYGWPGFPRDIHVVQRAGGRSIVEAPLTAVSLLGKRIPVGGGGYLRHFPARFTHWALRRVARQRPFIVYVHPCEVQTAPDPLDTTALDSERAQQVQRFHRRQLRGRDTTERKLTGMMSRFEFAPLADVIDNALGSTWRE